MSLVRIVLLFVSTSLVAFTTSVPVTTASPALGHEHDLEGARIVDELDRFNPRHDMTKEYGHPPDPSYGPNPSNVSRSFHSECVEEATAKMTLDTVCRFPSLGMVFDISTNAAWRIACPRTRWRRALRTVPGAAKVIAARCAFAVDRHGTLH
ncbi:hypothetical protein V8E36_001897 [Tilletia maclaganii]